VPSTLHALLDLERVASDFFVGASPDYPWGRVYGGQVVAQSLAAASATVDPAHRLHSLHAYFVLAGQPKVSILFEVDRLRDGRSFSTRRVVARQASGAILNLDASFQRVEHDLDIQESSFPVDVPAPESLERSPWGGLAEVREVPRRIGAAARSQVWLRFEEDLGDDPIRHACALGYLTDYNPMDAIMASHPNGADWQAMMNASLDHSVWFHRPARADSWLLFDMQGHGLVNARGLSTGSVFDQSGVHVATIVQEGLVRSPKPPTQAAP
jgi:acyl-CoA thioesterase II